MSNKVEQFGKLLSKIERLEASIEQISEKLAVGSGVSGIKKDRQRSNRVQKIKKEDASSRSSSKYLLSLKGVSSLDMLAEVVNLKEHYSNIDGRGAKAKGSKSERQKSERKNEGDHAPPLNCNPCSMFSMATSYTLLSPGGVEWMRTISLNSESDVARLARWHAAICAAQNSENHMIPTNNRELPNCTVLGILLESYKQSGVPTLSFIDVQKATNIFNEYQAGKSLNVAEMMILNVTLALSCLVIRLGLVGKELSSLLSLGTTPQLLKEYEDIFISNSLHLTYRVAMSLSGLQSIEALLCMVCYTALSGAVHASYLLISIVVRLAQDLGLHSDSMLDQLSPEDREKRRSIWWLCRLFDLRLAMVVGKPKAIANYDTTTKFPSANKHMELLEQVILGSSKKERDYDPKMGEDMYKMILQTDGFFPVARHYIFRLAAITSKVHENLYANAAERRPAVQYKIIKSILNELETLKLSLPKALRPEEKYEEPTVYKSEADHMGKHSRTWLAYEFRMDFSLDVMLIHWSLYKTETALKAANAIDYEPEYKGIEQSRLLLKSFTDIDPLYIGIILKAKPWPFIMAFFDMFHYSLVMQTDFDEYERDMNLMLAACCSLQAKLVKDIAFSESATETQFIRTIEDSSTNLYLQNLVSIFRCMLNILRNTLEAKIGRKIVLPNEDILQYEDEDCISEELIQQLQSVANPFDFLIFSSKNQHW